ncbi:MAG: ATP-binding cassette domain-containing protein [Bacteroidales bacterium]|nr:ATP-binding cassette domain-containing protein [Bacteroidales bacterium]
MQIQVHQFIPTPLAETFSNTSDIWKKDNLEIGNHAVTSIVSESGKGKSSLLSSIYGIRKDYYGSISIDGTDTKSFELLQWSILRKNRLSMVFQSLQLFPELSALDNILLKNSLSNHKTDKEILQMLEKLGMLPYKDQSAASLSFGQQQRIAILRALCQPYETILLDEPFSHLDDTNAKIAWELILQESNKQSAKVVITGLSENDFFKADQVLKL